MLRQVLSIALALALGYGGFQYFFVPHPRASPPAAAPTVAAFVAPATPPPIVVLPPPRPDICQQVTSGYYANGRPIGGQLWQILIARHPECFPAGPARSSGPPRLRH